MLFSTRAFQVEENGIPETPQSFDSTAPAITPIIRNSGLDFLRTEAGLLKLIEASLGILLTFFIAGYCNPSGIYSISLVIISACILGVLVLIFLYTHSLKMFYDIRRTPFETFFNASSSLVYLIFPTLLLLVGVNAGVIVVVLLGVILFVVHGYDSYKTYVWYKEVLK